MTDLLFEKYNQRQIQEISEEKILEKAKLITPSEHFRYENSGWIINEYSGYAVVSMVSCNPFNDLLPEKLVKLQNELTNKLNIEGALYLLPQESFHQTVANTLSADRFKSQLLERGLENEFPEIVDGAFRNATVGENNDGPVKMQLIGLSIFGTAIGVLGIFENELDYNRITRFRSKFYNDPELAEVDVKMTRPFIGHITIAYFGKDLDMAQKQCLGKVINDLNRNFEESDPSFFISNTELRRYKDLSKFERKNNYPLVHL